MNAADHPAYQDGREEWRALLAATIRAGILAMVLASPLILWITAPRKARHTLGPHLDKRWEHR